MSEASELPTQDRSQSGLDRPEGPILGAILCGGRSARFGSDKALAAIGEATMGERIVAAMRAAGADPVMAIGGTAGAVLSIPTIADLRPGDGPLGGLATALLWAKSGIVVVVPCDLPLLESGHIASIIAASQPGRAAVATIDGEPQISLACWPAEAGRAILKLVEGGTRRYMAALDVVDWVGVEVPAVAVTDADTTEELLRLWEGRGG